MPDPAPAGGAPEPPAGPPVAARTLADPPPFRWPSLRAVLVGLALLVLVGGLAYPAVVDVVERGTGAVSPSGGFVPGGDPSALAKDQFAQNVSDPALFWLRPSLTDYNAFASGESPYGPTDPALRNLTEQYLAQYGAGNATLPIDLVGNSESGLDPSLPPAAVLVQVPRVAAHTSFTQEFLMALVASHTVGPLAGVLGPSYVNVLTLDADLLALETAHPP